MNTLSLSLSAVGLLGLTLLGCWGCRGLSEPSASLTPMAAFQPDQSVPSNTARAVATIPQQLAAVAKGSSSALFSVCAEISDWQRPEEMVHIRQLEAIPRYGESIHQNPLKDLLAKFRSYQVISFSSYGLSARSEPLYLSGVWTAVDQMESCYSEDRTVRLNNGEIGEAWLLGYSAANFEWDGAAYVVSVEPAQGLQIIQFERQESSSDLPLRVTLENGAPVEVYSGDWSSP